MFRNRQFWLLWALNLATLPSMAGSRSGYGLTDTVAATAAVRADIPGTPGESDGFRLICCTCETESITGPELGQTPFGFCLPKPGNRPTGKNSVVWDSPSLGWWEETQLKNWLRLRRWGPPCEDHIEEREREDRAHRVAFLRRTVAAAINRLSSDSVLLLGYHMGGAWGWAPYAILTVSGMSGRANGIRERSLLNDTQS